MANLDVAGTNTQPTTTCLRDSNVMDESERLLSLQ